MKKILAALLLILPCLVRPAHAELKDVLDRGVIRVGVGVENPPFGSLDAQGTPVGYDVDMAKALAKALNVKLDLVQLTAPNRVPYLVTNKIDVLVASLAASPERAAAVMLSIPYAANELAVYGPRNLAVTKPGELGTHKVAVVKGTGQDVELAKIAPNNVVRFDSDSVADTAFFSGQTDLLGLVNTQVAALVKLRPSLDLTEKFPLQKLTIHMAVRQGDFQMLQFVNTFIFLERTSGDLDAAYKRYFGVDMPVLPSF